MQMPDTAITPDVASSARMLDPHSGLPSRSLFLDRLERATLAAPRGGGSFAVMMVEFGHADSLDEALGADEDARVCRELSRGMRAQLRKSDTLSRLSGSTYGILLPGTASPTGLTVLADRIIAAVRPFTAGSATGLALDASIGVAIYPDHGVDSTMLMRCADTAVAHAQREGCGVHIGRPTRTVSMSGSPVTVSDLRHAIEHGELVLHFHPKIDLGTRAVVGAEALVRWQRPGIGRQLPATFIPAAERLACIAPMTDAIVDLALDQAKTWLSAGMHLPVSVNVSDRSFDDPAFVGRMVRSLAQRGLASELLTLEITEAAITSHPARVQTALRELQAAGVRVALDDFGAGHSSLRVLRDLGLSEIKIDRQFVNGLRHAGKDASIVRSISALASGLEAQVVAEGIEDRETWDALLGLGCHLGQGYEIAHPMAAADFDVWLARWKSMAGNAIAAIPEAYYS